MLSFDSKHYKKGFIKFESKKLPMTFKIRIVFLLLIISLQIKAAKYYCDPSSIKSFANGTLATPWKNIDQVNNGTKALLAGDTVFFKRGQKFTGRLNIEKSGTAKNPIVYTAYGKGKLPIFDNAISDIITLRNQSYVVIDKIQFTDFSLLDKLHLLPANIFIAILLYNSPHCTISNCDFSLVGIGIATFTGSNYTNITGNNIHNLRMVRNTPILKNKNDDYGAVPIVLASSFNTITNNRFEDCWAISYDYGYDGGAIEFFGTDMNNNFIAYNTAINCNGFIEIGSNSKGTANNNVVAYNKIINCGTLGIFQNGGDYAASINNLQYYNNTIIETVKQFTIPGELFYKATNKGLAGMIVLKNNIFWCSNGSIIAGNKFNNKSMVRSNNIYRMQNGGLGSLTLAPTEFFSTSLKIFTTENKYPALWNCNLPRGTIAINFGTSVGLITDLNGKPINGNPDAGAYEYIPSNSTNRSSLKVFK